MQKVLSISLLFSALACAAQSHGACTATPSAYQAVLNNGSTTYYSLGKTVRARLTMILNQSVVMVVAGGGMGGNVEVFFLDSSTGQLLDGTWAQPHLSLPAPQPQFYSVLIDDVTGDGIPDIVVGARNYGMGWVYVGQGGGIGTLSFSNAYPLQPPAPNSNFGAALAVGDLNGDGTNEIALGLMSQGSRKSFTPGQVFLFAWNGNGFTNYESIADPENSSASGFGSAVAIGDITSDSNLDLAVGASGSSRVWVYEGNGLNGLTNPFSLTTGTSVGLGSGVAIAALPGDVSPFLGLLAVTNTSTAKGYIYTGPVTSNSAGSVLQPAELDWPQSALDLGDNNGDAVADVMIGSESTGCSGSAYLYESNGSSTYLAPQHFVGPLPSGNAVGYGSAASLVPGTKIVLVGDKYATVNGVSNAGQVYVYVLN